MAEFCTSVRFLIKVLPKSIILAGNSTDSVDSQNSNLLQYISCKNPTEEKKILTVLYDYDTLRVLFRTGDLIDRGLYRQTKYKLNTIPSMWKSYGVVGEYVVFDL